MLRRNIYIAMQHEAAYVLDTAASRTLHIQAEIQTGVGHMAVGRKASPKGAQMNAEMPQDAADLARRSVDQAQEVFDKASEFAHGGVQMFDAAAGALKANVAELQMKTMEIAQANTNAVFAHVRNLLSVRDPANFASLTQDFLAAQLQTAVRQASDLNELAMKFASETAKPVQDGLLRSYDDVKKAFEAK
jgi:hypothetical protein